VFAVNPQVPAAPTFLETVGCHLDWRDNSATEGGFKIERSAPNTESWSEVGTTVANVTSFCFVGDCSESTGHGITTLDYNFRVRAYNDFGNSAFSNVTRSQEAAVTSVAPPDESISAAAPLNFIPEVNITRPANREVVDNTFAIFANAFDADGNGTIVKVEFFADGNKLGEVTDAPYLFVWNNATSGPHSLTAKVSGNAGASTTSSPVNVIVGSSNAPPTISVTAPTNGATFNAPATMTISATASDTDGSISKVEFFQGPTKLGEDATAPYSFNWTNVGAGSYSLTATATDNLGATSTSAAVNIMVNGSNVSPTVSITAPTSGAVFTAPASFSITASASDTDGSVSKVEFFQHHHRPVE
jgi:predicted phage tail protein